MKHLRKFNEGLFGSDLSLLEVRDSIVNLLEYNEINFQEIDNILMDYNINVVNIWGLLR